MLACLPAVLMPLTLCMCHRTLMQKVFHAAIWEAVTAGVIALILGILYGTLSASSRLPAHTGRQHI